MQVLFDVSERERTVDEVQLWNLIDLNKLKSRDISTDRNKRSWLYVVYLYIAQLLNFSSTTYE